MVSKSLIAFFSRKGFNYANGGIINLPVGNTEIVAHKIQLLTGGGNDMFPHRTTDGLSHILYRDDRNSPERNAGKFPPCHTWRDRGYKPL